LPPHPDRFWGPSSLLIQWLLGALSPDVKRLGRETNYSIPAIAEFKKG